MAGKPPVQRRTIRPGNFTGCGAAWQRACFGSRRSGVQIPASRPAVLIVTPSARRLRVARDCVWPPSGVPSRCRPCPTRRAVRWAAPEHRDESGRVHRHRPGEAHPHLGAHHDVPGVGRRQPGDPEGDVVPGPGGAVRGHPLRQRRPTSMQSSRRRVSSPRPRRPSSTPTRRAASTDSWTHSPCWLSSRCWPWPWPGDCPLSPWGAPRAGTVTGGPTPESPSTPMQMRLPGADRSGPPQGDAAPGSLAARGAGHAAVEAAPGQPVAQRELEDQQVERAHMRSLAAALTLDREGTPFVERVARSHGPAVRFRARTRVEGALADRQRHARPGGSPRTLARRYRRGHPEQGALS